MKTYVGDMLPPERASARRLLGFMTLLSGLLVGGVVLGGLFFLSAQLVYLIVVSPLIAGTVALFWMVKVIESSRVRQRGLVIIASLLMTLLFFVTFWLGNYLMFLRDSRADLLAADSSLSPAVADMYINDYLREETDQTGFLGYFIWNTREGMQVKSESSYTPRNDDVSYAYDRSQEGSHWGTRTTIAYRLVEFLIVFGFVVGGGLGQAAAPFSPETQRWLEYKRVGIVPKDQVNEFLGAVQQGNFRHARTLIQSQKPRKPCLEVSVARFHALAQEARLKVVAHGKQMQQLMDVAIPPQVYETLSH